MDPQADAVEQLKDAYRALGSAVAELRSMPVRNYADVEEDLRVAGANRWITEAQAHANRACGALGRPAPHWVIEPNALGGSARALARPSVWGWIGQLHGARDEVAGLLRELGAQVPDDLPEGSPLERWAADPRARMVGTIGFGALVLGLILAAVMVGLTSS